MQTRKSAQSYDRKKVKAGERERIKTRSGQEIDQPPPPENLERLAAASASFRVFCETYFPHRFYLGWSADHLLVIARIEEAVRVGGNFAIAMPRGSGKTSLCEVACLWASMTGLHPFILLIGSSKEHALEMLQSIKEELLTNDLLAADFHSVCDPIAALEDRANRCKGQHVRGERTKIVWSTDKITLPTVAGSRASGATIRVAGITGRVRGAKKESIRPSLCVLDDPQTDSSANSLSQCEKRARVINGAVLGLAGPGKKITAIMPCTVIRRGDLADTFLDREKSPLWTGQRYKLVYKMPAAMARWEEYAVRRADELRNGGDGSQATAFYAGNRAVMDEGCVVAWPERFKPDELSGVQHAMNLLFADKWSFHAEYQNEPLSEDLGDEQLAADKVAARVNDLARRVVPLNCGKVTCFIDVQQRLLFWLICAWSESEFGGSIIDYGSYPDQGRQYFTASDAQKTIARASPGAGLETQIHAALGRLSDELLGRSFAREDGASLKIERMLVDAGFQGDTVKAWARTTHHAAIVLPSHGMGLTAASKPFSDYDRSRCEKLGMHWLIPKVAAGRQAQRYVLIDVNWWKTFLAQRLSQGPQDKGALRLFGRAGQDHRMLADHLTSEYWIETEGRGRTLHEWRMRPGQTENHWWDCLVGNAVAASMLGCGVMGGQEPAKKRKRLSLAEMARIAKEKREASKP